MAASSRSSLSVTQEFENMRSDYESRVNQLEHDVHKCCRLLQRQQRKEEKKQSKQLTNYTENNRFLSWQFNMSEFPVENIVIQLKNDHVHLHAYHKDKGQSLEVNREILMPEHVEKSKLSARLTPCGTLTISVPLKSALSDSQRGGH